MKRTMSPEQAERLAQFRGESSEPRPRTYELVNEGTGEVRTLWNVPADADFAVAEAEFLSDPNLDDLMDEVIGEFVELNWLAAFRVRILWQREGTGKREILGKCRVASGLLGLFSKADWVVTLAADNVHGSRFTEHQVKALIYHELKHCALVGEAEKPGIANHDLEMFTDELRHFGAWAADIQHARHAFRQLELMPKDPGAP